MNVIEHCHNSSWLEHGSAPEKATKTAFVYAIDKYLKDSGKYKKGRQDHLAGRGGLPHCCVNNFSERATRTRLEKSITNKFVQEAMTDFLKSPRRTYFIENRVRAFQNRQQVLINKKPRARKNSS